MKKLKPVLFGLVVGIAVGLWFGVNIGKGRSIFSNPFADRSVSQQIIYKFEQGRDKVGESVEKIGEDIKGDN